MVTDAVTRRTAVSVERTWRLGSETVRVASVPAAHPYVDHIRVPGAGFSVLADAPPVDATPGSWWPPVMFEPDWIRRHADEFDLFHLHFGMESYPVAHLAAVIAALRDVGRPLVYTVHDLQNPQLTDQTHHIAQLDQLMSAAAALVTLTPGAASEIERRWGRTSVVIPHPHIVPLDKQIPPGQSNDQIVVDMHLKDLRPNVDAVGMTRTLCSAVAEMADHGIPIRARIHLNDRVRQPSVKATVAQTCAQSHLVDLIEHPRLTDSQLIESLTAADVCVLPYSYGTHSGWLEMCWDLAVPVAVPAVGYYKEQHAEDTFRAVYTPGSSMDLAQAVAALTHDRDRPAPGSPARTQVQQDRRVGRAAQQARVAADHAHLYRRVLAGEVER